MKTILVPFTGISGNKIYLLIGKDAEGYNTVQSGQDGWKIVTPFIGSYYRCHKKETTIKLTCGVRNTQGSITERIDIDFSKFKV